MLELEEEKKAIITLIESWNNDNINLALEILKGLNPLIKIVKAHYRDLLKSLFNKVRLEDFINFPQKLGELIKSKKEIPYFRELENVLPLVPIGRLNLSDNNLRSIPWWVFLMPQLTELNLRNNFISNIPSEIANLTKLEVLDLTINHIKTIPDAIGNLSKLEKLQLDFNEIVFIPQSIGKLTKLQWLCLEANKIESLPQSVKALQSLWWISIEKTPLGIQHNIHGGLHISVTDNLFQKLLER